jgi:hypothetical protein
MVSIDIYGLHMVFMNTIWRHQTLVFMVTTLQIYGLHMVFMNTIMASPNSRIHGYHTTDGQSIHALLIEIRRQKGAVPEGILVGFKPAGGGEFTSY